MMKKSIKIIILILVLSFISVNKIYAITDVPISFDHGYSGSGGGPGSSGPPKPNGSYTTSGTGRDGLTHNYKCEYYYSTSVSTNIKVNTYDMNGKSLMSGSTIVNNVFKSGTWIGLWNAEYKKVTWSVSQSSLKCYEVLYTYDCKYSYQGSTSYTNTSRCSKGRTYDYSECSQVCRNLGISFNSFSGGTCYCNCYSTTSVPTTKYYSVHYTNTPKADCPTYSYNGDRLYSTDNKTEKTTEVNNAALLSEALTAAKGVAKNAALNRIGGPIGNVTFLQETTKNGEVVTEEKALPSHALYSPAKYTDGTWSGYYEQWFIFEPKLVCLNLLTGAVEYKNSGSCNEEQIEVTGGTGSDGNKYWRYFIPMKTLTGSDFYIKLGKDNANTKLVPEECSSLIKKYPLEDDYLHYIKTSSGTSLTGIPNDDEKTISTDGGCREIKTNKQMSVSECQKVMENHQMNNDYTHYITSLNSSVKFSTKKSEEKKNLSDISNRGGCRFAVTVTYNIKQKFYGETESYKSLKGYGMYFRQIDINNPFPEPIKKDSYWYKLYDKDTKIVNKKTKLATSFDKPTYIASLTKRNIDIVRDYNTKYPYTKWSGDIEAGLKVYGMNTNGSSMFINQNSNIFVNKSNLARGVTTTKTKYYKLGCGPANEDWSGCK